MSFLKNLFSSPDYSEMIKAGAPIIDVRSPQEFKGGHPKGAINIPVDTISGSVDRIKKFNGPVVLCCASGMRSGKATKILKNHGVEAYNAGAWTNLA